MRKLVIVLILSLVSLRVIPQELLCNVDINTQQIQASDRKIYESLRTAIYEFMNNRIWTNYTFKGVERIECSVLLTINERTTTEDFKGEITIAFRRPVFNSTYNSPMLNFVDKNVDFQYLEFQSMDFNENMFTNNLTSVLAFYAYLIIGIDFDSFAPDGGSPFYETAQNIMNVAQNSAYKGWKSYESQKNRYWLLENLTNASYSGIRSFYYDYHMKGMDMMYEDPVKARTEIINSLKYLQQIKKSRPSLLFLQVISDAKRDELVSIFQEGSGVEKSQAVALLKEIDPANSLTYQKILQQ